MAHEPLSTPEVERRRQQRRESRQTQTYKAFLKRLCEGGRYSEEFAEAAAVSVLCALEQRVMPEEAKDMEAQLPMMLQTMLYRCDRHIGAKPLRFGRDEFLDMVAEDLGMAESEVEPVIRAVFSAVRDQVSEGEIEQVMMQLPNDLRELWQRSI